jgi:hypothetical protein
VSSQPPSSKEQGPDFEQVVGSLSSFSQEQLRDLRARCESLLRPADDVGEITYLLAAFSKQGAHFPPLSVIARSRNYGRFKEAVERLATWARQNKFKTRPQRLQLYLLFAKIVIRSLSARKLPVSVATTLPLLETAPSVIDSEFPGYAEANLLSMVLRKR